MAYTVNTEYIMSLSDDDYTEYENELKTLEDKMMILSDHKEIQLESKIYDEEINIIKIRLIGYKNTIVNLTHDKIILKQEIFELKRQLRKSERLKLMK